MSRGKEEKLVESTSYIYDYFCYYFLAGIASYIIPAGEFERVEDEEGRMLVVDGSYHHIESEPVSFLKCLQRFQWVSKKGLKLFSTFFSQWCFWYYSFYRCY